MGDSFTDRFFEGVETPKRIDDKKYAEIEQRIKILDVYAPLMHQSTYVLDFYKRKFLYVSPNPLFLCGYPPRDALESGYEFYAKVVYPADLPLLIRIHKIILDYFRQLPQNFRDLGFAGFNFRVVYRKKALMVNHKVKPLTLTDDGDIWLAICSVSPSVQKKSGNLFIYWDNQPARLEYDFDADKWSKQAVPKLDDVEKSILLLAEQGFGNKRIADCLCLSEKTVKNRKTIIFKKLNTSSGIESAITAINQRLL